MPDLGRMFPYDASDVCDPCLVCDNLPSVLKIGSEWQAGCPHCGVCADLAQDRLTALVKWNLLNRKGISTCVERIGGSRCTITSKKKV